MSNNEANNEITVLSAADVENYFKHLIAYAIRVKAFPTVILLSVQQSTIGFSKKHLAIVEKHINDFLLKQVRLSDMLCQISPAEWAIVLMDSGNKEANAFISRLLHAWNKITDADVPTVKWMFCLAEIKQKVMFSEIIAKAQLMLSQRVDDRLGDEEPDASDLFMPQVKIASHSIAIPESKSHDSNTEIFILNEFHDVDRETIRISLIDDDEGFLRVLQLKLDSMSIAQTHLNIRQFQDGYEFIQHDDWYVSGHRHLIVMDELTARWNGYDVLHTIRRSPNEKRFGIFMFTDRYAETNMIYALEHGVDDFLMKPLNLDVFEMKVRKFVENR